jgi:glutamate-5-semialdehyde dehydrogenase
MVLRIGSDALGTARAIVDRALRPALVESGLPLDTVRLVDSPTRASGQALFNDSRLAMAVARGSGPAVRQLGAVATQAGTPASLHGTGGAWLVVAGEVDEAVLHGAVRNSLDRKVCNTLNVVAVLRERASDLVPIVLDAVMQAAGDLGTTPRLHVAAGAVEAIPPDHAVRPHLLGPMPEADLAIEWEWDSEPELSLVVVDDLDHAVELFNRHSPHFVASLISARSDDHDLFYAAVEAPFVGDGFTRWVDGQYALHRPELGLSNWEFGRLLGRGAILSGEAIRTLRYRARITDPAVRR